MKRFKKDYRSLIAKRWLIQSKEEEEEAPKEENQNEEKLTRIAGLAKVGRPRISRKKRH
jgi:hypothetical protein